MPSAPSSALHPDRRHSNPHSDEVDQTLHCKVYTRRIGMQLPLEYNQRPIGTPINLSGALYLVRCPTSTRRRIDSARSSWILGSYRCVNRWVLLSPSASASQSEWVQASEWLSSALNFSAPACAAYQSATRMLASQVLPTDQYEQQTNISYRRVWPTNYDSPNYAFSRLTNKSPSSPISY